MRSYLIAVGCVILVGTVFDLLVPSGNLRKYIKPILGIIMVITIVKPLLSLRVPGKEMLFDSENSAAQDYTEKVYEKNVSRAFSKSLAEKITSVLKTNGISVYDCRVETEFCQETLCIRRVAIYTEQVNKAEYLRTVLKRELSLNQDIVTVLPAEKKE